jgi:hypothetical protein
VFAFRAGAWGVAEESAVCLLSELALGALLRRVLCVCFPSWRSERGLSSRARKGAAGLELTARSSPSIPALGIDGSFLAVHPCFRN